MSKINNFSPYLCLLIGLSWSANSFAMFSLTDTYYAGGNAVQAIYSEDYDALVYRNSASAVRSINFGTGGASLNLAFNSFYDMDSLSAGRYVYVTDYGGERTGYGTPLRQHFVHRYDLQTETWSVKTTNGIAGKIESVTDDKFLLLERDQWVSMTLEQWGDSGSTVQLSNSRADYRGDFEYDESTGRILHGNSGSSSREINTWRLVGNDFYSQESTGTYGSAQGGGGSSVLSTDGSAFYYGAMKVEALDVTNTLRVFDETIFAAFEDVAFGENAYYDAITGEKIGSLGFTSSVYALASSGNSFWAFNENDDTFYEFSRVAAVPLPASAWLFGCALAGIFSLRKRT